ncbi:hypothetical protein RyT2_18290 [Pseudolactococcus yaeyamensis]
MKRSQKIKKTNNSKKQISTLILIVASLVMVSTIIFLVQNQSKSKPKPNNNQVLNNLQVIKKQSESSQGKIKPMQENNLDFDEKLDQIGQVVIDKVGLDLPIVKGRGKEDGTGFDKAIYACTNKKDQILGVNNYVLSAHSTYLSATDYFSPLLVNEDGSFDMAQPIVLEKLKLKAGDEITIKQYSDNMNYRFKVTQLFVDEGQGNFIATYEAMGDRVNQPQLTLYTCSDIDGKNRLVIQADFLDKTSLPA